MRSRKLLSLGGKLFYCLFNLHLKVKKIMVLYFFMNVIYYFFSNYFWPCLNHNPVFIYD